MPFRTALALILCLLAGTVSFLSLVPLRRSQIGDFARSEAYFNYPIAVNSSKVKIRRDSYGKGYFGASRDGGRTHQGVDLSVEARMPIYASKSGRIAFAGEGKGYGKYVEIAHPDGRSTRYAHLSELCCQRGDWVALGRVIGVSGKTGNASNRHIRPHLHFEIRHLGKSVNPAGLMDPAVVLG